MWIEKLKLIGILLIIKKRKIRKTPPSKKKTICCLYKIHSYITQQQPAAHCYKSQRQPGCERCRTSTFCLKQGIESGDFLEVKRVDFLEEKYMI